jgi:Uma2 family endonuclease
MSGTSQAHNTIALNLASALRARLKGGSCHVFMSDIRVHLKLQSDDYYYYPDVIVTCDKRDLADHQSQFVEHPKVIIEVLSDSAERVDKREKFFAYSQIASLQEYLLVSQKTPEVIVFRRASQWRPEQVTEAKASVAIKALRLRLPLKTIYEGV